MSFIHVSAVLQTELTYIFMCFLDSVQVEFEQAQFDILRSTGRDFTNYKYNTFSFFLLHGLLKCIETSLCIHFINRAAAISDRRDRCVRFPNFPSSVDIETFRYFCCPLYYLSTMISRNNKDIGPSS